MDRRKSIKAMALGTLSTGLLLDACKEADKKPVDSKETSTSSKIDRMKEEEEHFSKISAETFFDAHEMATITILADIILPKDDISGNASDAKVPEFIEFIVKDM